MKWRTPSPADPDVTLVRPLLHLSKAAILRFSSEENIPFREDSSNASPDHLRNRVRHDLLPRLRRDYQPAIDLTLTRLMDIAGAEADHMNAEAESWLRSNQATRASFNDLSLALQRIVLRKEVRQCGVVPEFDLIEQLRLHPGAWVTAPGSIRLSRTPDGSVSAAPASPASDPGWTTERKILRLTKTSGRVRFGDLEIQWKRTPHHTLPRHTQGVEFFDAARIGSQITLRHWRQGDHFQPIGMPRPVKLQNLFINARIPRERRHQLIVAESQSGDIFWVEGLRIGDIARVTETTRRMLRWEIIRTQPVIRD
jgi:tRNA(Ile)-lysidine synthase